MISLLSFSTPVIYGIRWGLGIAFAQSVFSAALLRMAWQQTWFYLIWGSGMAIRLVVFVATAFVVHLFSSLDVLATLLSLATASTIFMLVESIFLLRKTNGLSKAT